MKNEAEIGNKASASVVRGRGAQDTFKLKGKYEIEHWGAPDKDGNRKLLRKFEVPNGVTDVGKDHVLDVVFHNSPAPSATWYLSFIDNAGFTALADADTMASHAGWTEFTTYSEGTRVAWPEDAASGQAMTNTTSADFNISGSGTLYGVFLVDQNTKGGTTGTLFGTAAFASTIPVNASDLIKVTYTVSIT